MRSVLSLADGVPPPIIVAVTADAMQGAKESCLAAGINDYISKPVDKNTLESRLVKWLSPIDKSESEVHSGDTPDDDQVISFDHIVNRQRLKEFTQGDDDVEEQIISIFMESLKSDIEILHRLFHAQRYEEWQDIIHKLYGAASNMGVEELSRLCETVLETSDLNEGTVKRFHAAICHEYKQICAALLYSKAV